MNTILLKENKNSLTHFVTVKYLFLTLLLSLIGALSANAQCVGPYQYFEGMNSSSALIASDGYPNSVTSVQSTTSASYSGKYSVVLGAIGKYIQTPSIAHPGSLSFYYKSTVTGWSFNIDYSSSSSFTTFTTLTNFTSASSVGWTQGTVDISTIPANSYVRIYCAVNKAVFIDDLAITSSVASENTILILAKGGSNVGTTTLASGIVYDFYDNGGNTDTFSPSQSNTVTFSPPAGYQIKVNFLSFDTSGTGAASTGAMTFANYSGTPAVSGYTAAATTFPTPNYYLGTSSSPANSMDIAFGSTSSTSPGGGFHLTVECALIVATCNDVSAVGLTANSTTNNGATINWTIPTPNASGGYDYYISTSNSTPIPSTTPTGNIASPAATTAAISGLSSGTTYYVWIRSNCGSVNGTWITGTGTTSFTTLCAPTSLTYLENFNGLNGPLPTCTSTDSAANWQTNIVNGNLFGNVAGTSFFTKAVNLTTGVTYRLTYDFSTINGTADFSVYYGTSNYAPTSISSWNSIATHAGISVISSNMVDFTVSTPGIYYIKFRLDAVANAGSTQFNLDNIILQLEDCTPPTSWVGTPTHTTTSGTVTWTAPSPAPSNGYQYYISTSNTAPTSTVPITGSVAAGTTTVTITGLTPSTTYYVWVRSNCGTDFSTWSTTSTSFTTDNVPLATVINMTTGSNSGCGTYLFYDHGGSAANYNNSESYTYTFTPTAGSSIKVVFSSFSTENGWDGLSIYNGNSTAAPLISSGLPVGIFPTTCPAGSFYGTTSPGTIYSTASDGSLTFKFTSDTSVTYAGWAATVTCVTLPTITSFTPNNNNCGGTGTSVTITGTNFTGATKVTFNGVPAVYTVVNSTTITATLPAGATTGAIGVTNATGDAVGYSATSFTVSAAAPTTTGVSICAGGVGALTTSTSCVGYENAGTTINGTWAAGNASAPRPTSSTNSSICSFSGTSQQYTAIQFQVSTTGTYTFSMSDPGTYDGMGYITTGAFTPGSCATGTWVVGDDDSGPGLQPQMSAVLTAGVTYTLYTTTYSTPSSYYSYTWNITPPVGGQVMTYNSAAQMQWFTVATGGTAVGTGASFNPVGVAAVVSAYPGLANTNTPGTYNFYAACTSNPTCRTLTTFVVKAGPTVTITPGATICSNSVVGVNAGGTAGTSYVWSSSVPNTIYTSPSATTLYSGTNLPSVYVKTPSTVTITVVGTLTSTGCTATNSSTFTVSTKTWNGSWNGNGLPPTINEGIIINANWTGGNLQGCNCTVNAGSVTFSSGQVLNLQNELVVSGGSVNFASGSSLIQANDVTNTGNINYSRDVLTRKYDYVYWSSPVANFVVNNISPTTPTSLLWKWDAALANGNNAQGSYLNAAGDTMIAGKGYLVRGPNSFTNTPATYTATFTGVPNNGTIATTIKRGSYTGANYNGTNGALITNMDDNWNLIGNPYPSALYCFDFLDNNSNIEGAIRLWTHGILPSTSVSNPFYGSYYSNYDPSDYITYNGVGTVSGPSGFNGYIGAGQGFFVLMNDGPATSDVVYFYNFMRDSSYNNTQFYKYTSNSSSTSAQAPIERNRIWLDLVDSNNTSVRTLVGYVTNATTGLDRMFDAYQSVTNVNTIYTTAANTNLCIQGRPLPFDNSDVVNIGVNIATVGDYSIAIAAVDGLFEQGQAIYLKDNLLGVLHDLRQAPYTFTATTTGMINGRFELRYQDAALNTDQFVKDSNLTAFINNGQLNVKASSNIDAVQIYDVTGKLIRTYSPTQKSTIFKDDFSFANGVYLAKIKLENGAVVTQKLMN
jgi:hypothetical protein